MEPQYVIDLLELYWWAIMALTASPLIGYAVTQRYKAWKKRQGGASSSDLFKGGLAGIITFTLSFAFWFKYEMDWQAALYMALAIGVFQPFIVRGLMGVLKRKAPKVYDELAAGVDEKTRFTPFGNDRTRRLTPEEVEDITGAHKIG